MALIYQIILLFTLRYLILLVQMLIGSSLMCISFINIVGIKVTLTVIITVQVLCFKGFVGTESAVVMA